jgi:alginate O-acetyltransferase complex protein AlgI
MDSASIQFVCFGLLVAAVSNVSKSPAWRSWVLMLASLLFVALLAGNFMSLLPLFGFLLLGYVGVQLLQRGWARSFALTVCAVILIYAWLKKYTLLPEKTQLHYAYLTVGLSYIFFRILQLLIETRECGAARHISVSRYLLHTINFTTFVSGPIQRYDDFVRDQFAGEPQALGAVDIGVAFQRIILGFFKVNVLSMLLRAVHGMALLQLHQPLPMSTKIFAAFRLSIVYPFFLYCNFSGYIDIVIALARLMRVSLPENFDRPFSATSFLDFWNRWHITLSLWLKTNVYNPMLLTLMRRNTRPALEPFLGVFCFFVTFFLIGIWHGRTSEFIVFGLLQGGGVAINKLWQLWLSKEVGAKSYRVLAAGLVYQSVARGLTFTWFAFTLYWFWASWRQLHVIFHDLGLIQWLAVWMATWASATLVLAWWEWLLASALSLRVRTVPLISNRYVFVGYATVLAFIAFVVTSVMNQPAVIVYKTF